VHSISKLVRLVLPMKSFRHGKQRLAAVLTDAQRHALSLRLATELVDCNRDLDPLIVTNDPEVTQWALTKGVEVHQPLQPGLNEAVDSALQFLRNQTTQAGGPVSLVVAHCDLAFPRSLAFVAEFDGISIIPDRHDDGTNVLCLPINVDFVFRYGASSFANHHEMALATGKAVRVLRDASLGIDVDTPEDLRLLEARGSN
jgi:2-phospho-L-lactate/phosphoenolpyruvate guanylyltransferase